MQVETTLYSLSESLPIPAERRGDERHLTLFRVGSLSIGDRRELCLIKNISAGGMLIRAYCDIAPGSQVSIELKQGEQINGTVGWMRDNCAGIAFDAPVDVIALLAASMDSRRPRMPRVEICSTVSIRQESQVYGMRARDISQGGMKVETDRELAIGGDVVVTLPGLQSQQGVVRWQQSGCYGINFNRLLSLAELVSWLQDQRETLRAAS